MTNLEKKKLYRELSYRLPYGVKVCINNNPKLIGTLIGIVGDNVIVFSSGRIQTNIENVKPYLRRVESMSDIEKQIYNSLLTDIDKNYHNIKSLSLINDWLNGFMFDYDNIIDLGLANEASEGIYVLRSLLPIINIIK